MAILLKQAELGLRQNALVVTLEESSSVGRPSSPQESPSHHNEETHKEPPVWRSPKASQVDRHHDSTGHLQQHGIKHHTFDVDRRIDEKPEILCPDELHGEETEP
jgi:hypothetical protein